MRPTRLSMTNFMPYAQPTELDLSGLHLACLAGENGHGKSAIIDALTWALWGKARARRDDELIHLGEEQMEVRLDFQLGDQEYRVIRQRDSAGRGNSTLEFQVESNSHWKPMTGDSIKETQEIIDSTIGMDYHLFINSALLLQGRADEFTNQPPGERKRILGEILDLGLWDGLEERAKAKAREAEAEVMRIQARAEQMTEELERQADHEANLNAAASEVDRLQGELKEAEHSLSAVKEKATELSLKRASLVEIEDQGRQKIAERGAIQRKISNADETLGEELHSAVDQSVQYQKELEEVEARIARLDPQAMEKSKKLLRDVRCQLDDLSDLEDKRQIEEGERATLSEERATLTATNSNLREDMDALKEEMKTLQGLGGTCPLCHSELSEEHRAEILAGKQGEGEEKAAQYRQNKERIEQRDSQIASCQSRLRAIEMNLANQKELRAKETGLVGRLAKLEAEENQLAEWRERVPKLQQAIDETKARYQAMRQARIAEWQAEADRLEEAVAELSAKRDALRAEMAEMDRIIREKQDLQGTVDRLAEEFSRANLRVGAAQQQIEHCRYLAGEKEKLEQQFEEASRSKAMYDQLRTAFGKKGIQAMIIETVLPEIEEQANELLARMTDGRMSVAFESQRETKKGDISETLDIQVSDELGVRSYDLFSGGERFRLDFAIRIAISKLLARRAGARLQTLIMDEGFGSQDASGRDRLVEAIQSVAGDFELILVVTHIEELREAFPNRIEVVKGPAGSLISVN